MKSPTALETMLERLAILDQQIEALQARLQAHRRKGHATAADLEQTIALLVAAKSVYLESLRQVETPWLRPLADPPRDGE